MSILVDQTQEAHTKAEGELKDLLVIFTNILEAYAKAEQAVEEKKKEAAQIAGALAFLKGERAELEVPAKPENPRKQKQPQTDNPYADTMCNSCGTKGKLFESNVTVPSGKMMRMVVCRECNNQTPI